MTITLKQLAVFTATARLKSISNAAKALFLTQSAASQSLKELETSLGYQLFNRVGRTLLLNDHGKALLPTANQMLALQQKIEAPEQHIIQGELHVAASVTIGSYLLPKLLADFVKNHPKVEPKLLISNSDDVMARLNSGQAHIGLIEAPIDHPSLHISPWRHDQLTVFCAANHPLAQQNTVSFNELLKQRWILREHGSGTRSVFTNAMLQHGFIVENSMDLSRQEAIKQAVLAQLGIGVLSQLSIQQEIALGVFKPLNTPLNLQRQFSLVQSEHFQHHAVVTKFHEFILAH